MDAMGGPVFDKREQLDTVAAGLLDGERIIAVYDTADAGTGFLGLTDLRVVLQDAASGGRTAITSIPYARIGTVSFVTDRNAPGRSADAAAVALSVGADTYEVTLRDDGAARHAHDVVLWHLTRA